jgi:hypothetical protein
MYKHAFYRSLHSMHYIYVSGSHLHVAIDHAEQGRVESPESAPVEGPDYEQDQDKPQCI